MTKEEVLAKVYEVIDQQIQYQIEKQYETGGTTPMYIAAIHREDELYILRRKFRKLFSE